MVAGRTAAAASAVADVAVTMARWCGVVVVVVHVTAAAVAVVVGGQR